MDGNDGIKKAGGTAGLVGPRNEGPLPPSRRPGIDLGRSVFGREGAGKYDKLGGTAASPPASDAAAATVRAGDLGRAEQSRGRAAEGETETEETTRTHGRGHKKEKESHRSVNALLHLAARHPAEKLSDAERAKLDAHLATNPERLPPTVKPGSWLATQLNLTAPGTDASASGEGASPTSETSAYAWDARAGQFRRQRVAPKEGPAASGDAQPQAQPVTVPVTDGAEPPEPQTAES